MSIWVKECLNNVHSLNSCCLYDFATNSNSSPCSLNSSDGIPIKWGETQNDRWELCVQVWLPACNMVHKVLGIRAGNQPSSHNKWQGKKFWTWHFFPQIVSHFVQLESPHIHPVVAICHQTGYKHCCQGLLQLSQVLIREWLANYALFGARKSGVVALYHIIRMYFHQLLHIQVIEEQ